MIRNCNFSSFNISGLLTEVSVCAICPEGGTTDISVKVFEFSLRMTDISVQLRLYDKIVFEYFMFLQSIIIR